MKKNILSAFILFTVTLSVCSQTTGLFIYRDGYFVKSNNEWQEFRPNDKPGVWAAYTQKNENDAYYYINNKECELAIPKNSYDKIYIKKNGNWETIYNTKEVYRLYPEKNRLIYCYKGGYFIREGKQWREYRPNKKASLWAEFKQYSEDDNFYMIESIHNKVAIPKENGNSFYIMRGERWSPCYTTLAIYDISSNYEFNFYFSSYKKADKRGRLCETKGEARISFNRNGNLQIAYGNKHHDIKFKEISTLYYKNSNTPIGIELTIDKENKIQLVSSNLCMIRLAPTVPYMNFANGDNDGKVNNVIELIENNSFFTK